MTIDRRNFVFVLRRGPLTLADGRVLLEGEELWQPALVSIFQLTYALYIAAK